MKISYNYLKTFFKNPENLLSPENLANFMTKNICENDPVEYIGEIFRDIEIVKVVEISKHENAEKLKIVKIKNSKNKILEAITGADNLKKGDIVPLVEKSGFVPIGFTVEEKNLRGKISERVLLSEKEMTIGQDHSGIFVFPENTKLGKFLDVLPEFDDHRLTIDNKALSNRGDMFSHFGVARELSVFFENLGGIKNLDEMCNDIELIENSEKFSFEKIHEDVSFFSVVQTEISEEKSDLKTSAILITCGIRPISKLVDATNFAMITTGQPFHVFDAEKLDSFSLGARYAKPSEKIKTLDDETRKLESSDMVVINNDKPIGIAGVMGGKSTEANKNTKKILIEAATWPKKKISKTARKFNLLSEAAQRFEHWVDPHFTKTAQKFILNHLNIDISSAKYYEYKNENHHDFKYMNDPEKRTIILDKNLATKMIGHEISEKTQKECLEKIGCKIQHHNSDDCFSVFPPTWRPDLNISQDLVEEINRYDRLEKISESPIISKSTPAKILEDIDLEMKVKEIMISAGMNEICTYSFLIDEKMIETLYIDEKNLIKVENAPYNFMRPNLSANIVSSVEKNRGFYDEIKIFETGKIFQKSSKSDILPIDENREKKSLAFAIMSKKLTNEIIQEINGTIKVLSEKLFLKYKDLKSKMKIQIFEKNPDLKLKNANLVVCEIDFEKLKTVKKSKSIFYEIPKFPPVIRDFNFDLEKSQKISDLKSKLEKILAPKKPDQDFQTEYEIIDYFEKNDIKRTTVRFRFSNENRTLKKSEIDEFMKKF